jgi:hypothetical protein
MKGNVPHWAWRADGSEDSTPTLTTRLGAGPAWPAWPACIGACRCKAFLSTWPLIDSPPRHSQECRQDRRMALRTRVDCVSVSSDSL